jgi:transcriptional regulator with XRE-family HTH domain
MANVNETIANILDRPSGKAASERQTLIVEVAHMIRAWRVEAGLTQAELANRIGTGQTAISKLESYDNDHIPSVSTLIDIAHACGRQLLLGSQPAAGSSLAPSGKATAGQQLLAV